MPRRTFSAVFGSVVRKHRLDLGLSQEALADKALIHRTHVGLIERGERSASLDVAKALADALDLTLAELVAEVEGQ